MFDEGHALAECNGNLTVYRANVTEAARVADEFGEPRERHAPADDLATVIKLNSVRYPREVDAATFASIRRMMATANSSLPFQATGQLAVASVYLSP